MVPQSSVQKIAAQLRLYGHLCGASTDIEMNTCIGRVDLHRARSANSATFERRCAGFRVISNETYTPSDKNLALA